MLVLSYNIDSRVNGVYLLLLFFFFWGGGGGGGMGGWGGVSFFFFFHTNTSPCFFFVQETLSKPYDSLFSYLEYLSGKVLE